MKKVTLIVCLLCVVTLFLNFSLAYSPESTDSSVVTASTPDIIFFDIIPVVTPTPPPPLPTPTIAPIVINDYKLDVAAVEKLAKLLWSSPLKDKVKKAALAWLVCNRASLEKYDGDVSAVISTTEFAFYDKRAHISQENLVIATLVLNQWYSEKSGNNVGRLIPEDALYLVFQGDSNRDIQFLTSKDDVEYVSWPLPGAYDYYSIEVK